jgi:hypothetical protein
MENFDDIKKLWNEKTAVKAYDSAINSERLDEIISHRLKKVQGSFREYFWASFFYQNLVYACLAFLVIKFFKRTDIVVISLAGIAVYIPFTIVFMKKFKSAFLTNKEGREYSNDDLFANIQNSYKKMSEFFSFKKKFDWIMIPVNCVMIVIINFILFVPGGFASNLIAAAVLFVVWVGIFLIAIRFENRKKFIEPIKQMESILEEFRES